MLASCSTAATEPEKAADPLDRDGTAASAAWTLDADVMSQPEIVDGVALVSARKAGGAEVIAVDAQDGHELWRRDVHPGHAAPGISLMPQVTKTASGTNAAVFLQAAAAPADDWGVSWWTAPVAVDLRSGEELYRGEPAIVTGRPSACDDGRDLCLTSTVYGGAEAKRVDLDTGAVSAGPSVVPLTGNFRSVGDAGLYSVVENDTEYLARVSDGTELWKSEITSIFGPGSTTNLGWNFDYYEDLDLYVGRVGVNPAPEMTTAQLFESGVSMELSRWSLIGIEGATGQVKWTSKGADNACSTGVGTPDSRKEGDLPVRCEYTKGSVRLSDGKYEGAEAKAVGYDLETGEAKWETGTVPVTDAAPMIVPSVSRGQSFLFAGAGGLELVGTRTGDSRPATDDDVFLCAKGTEYALPADSPFEATYGELGTRGAGGTLLFACGKDGEPGAELTMGALQDVDTVDGNIAVVATDGQLAGYSL